MLFFIKGVTVQNGSKGRTGASGESGKVSVNYVNVSACVCVCASVFPVSSFFPLRCALKECTAPSLERGQIRDRTENAELALIESCGSVQAHQSICDRSKQPATKDTGNKQRHEMEKILKKKRAVVRVDIQSKSISFI